jgi:hypothetical protein
MSEQPLSVAELTELPDDSWVNAGFTAAVLSIEKKGYTDKKTGAPRSMFICQLGDTTGSATVELAMFTAPKFGIGDQVDFLGKGIKFKNGQYGPKVSVGDKAEIHVIGKSAHAAEQKERAANSAPAVNGDAPAFRGEAVGMAVKESIALTVMAWGGVGKLEEVKDPLFWADVKTIASNILRICRSLEHGKLSPSPWQSAEPKAERAAPPPQQQQTPPARRGSPQTDRQAANLAEEPLDDSSIPF